MQNIEIRIAMLALLFVVTIATGIWLSHLGKPLNIAIFTIHKLIALIFVILASMVIFQLQKPLGLTPLVITLGAISLLLVLALFITGALLSLGKPVNMLVSIIHKIAPILAAVFISSTLYLIITGKK